MTNPLDQIADEITALEQRLNLISDESFLSQFSDQQRLIYEAEAVQLTSLINNKVLEAKDVAEFLINENASKLNKYITQFKSSRVDPFISEVGGQIPTIPEVLEVLEAQLDVEKLNQVVDIYNKVNSIRNQSAAIVSRARAISVPNITIPPIANIINSIIKKILANITGGLSVTKSQFSKVRADWTGPDKIRGVLSDQYGGIVKK